LYQTKHFSKLRGTNLVMTTLIRLGYRIYRTYLKKYKREKLLLKAKQRLLERFKLSFPVDDKMFLPDYLDLENLIDRIMLLKPSKVLEIGGGYSTKAIAFALSEAFKGTSTVPKLVTIDQSAYYLEKTQKLVGDVTGVSIEYLHRELYVDQLNGEKMSFVSDLPDDIFDFVYEDRHDHPEAPIAGDILILEQRAIDNDADFNFTIDLMISTAGACKRWLKRNYNVTGEYLTGTNFTQIKSKS